jgi:hypothetical protein
MPLSVRTIVADGAVIPALDLRREFRILFVEGANHLGKFPARILDPRFKARGRKALPQRGILSRRRNNIPLKQMYHLTAPISGSRL